MAESAEQRPEVGTTVAGRYLIEDLLGRGGMSCVYRARDLRGDRLVALKRSSAVSPRKARKQQQLLEREFNTLAQLAHPSIIEVYDYGVEEEGAPYYTMELLDGADLHQSGALPWRRACALLRDVASSLAILHSRGMIHRDVSSRNVRCTSDGRAKLIDFGAMTSMGVARDVVGTPPFLAPEVLQMQALDARADLFSLGALAYYLLTGRHAYPARRLSELRDVWRSQPTPPNRLVADVPSALSALVMQLLALDRGARAHSAPDVMSRLCSVAGLPLAEQPQVSRAYLTTPTLVGRERELITVRRRMLSLARSDGGTLLIEGDPGTGRSRLLDACALEAKLAGAEVVRAGASGERSDWEVARVIGAQLVRLMPEQAREAARLSAEALSSVIDDLRAPGGRAQSATALDRNLLIRELRDFTLALARAQRLVLIVDDVDHIDESSAALLAALAHKTERHPLILVLSIDRESKHSPSAWLRLLCLMGESVELRQLGPEQTESLVGSVFGAVSNLPLIAAKIHALSQGNPRVIMELAQHLVDRGLARYEAGSWSLPANLHEHDLPASLSASLAARLSEVSQDAREVCEVLSLADPDGAAVSMADLTELSKHHDPKRVFGALDELLAARILVGDGDHYRFSQRGFLSVVDQAISPPRRMAIHAYLADLLAQCGGELVERARHLLAAGRDLQAIEVLRSIDLARRPAPVPLLELAIERAEQLKLPTRNVHDLRRALLIRATITMSFESYLHHAPRVLAQLMRDSGYARYLELSELAEPERLTRALTETQARYDETPDRDRVYAVPKALSEFAIFSVAARGIGVLMLDREFMESLPSLAPFAGLSPALQLVKLACDATVEWMYGRFGRAHTAFTQVLTRLAEPDHAGLGEAEHARIWLTMHYGLGLLAASRGMPAALTHADVLEQARDYRVNAWRVRRLWHLSRGDVDEASKCQRRSELLQLQDGVEQSYAGTNMLSELATCVLAGDLLGIKAAMEAIEGLAARLPGWRPFLAYGQASRLQLQGDFDNALTTLLPALAAAPAGEHPGFGFLAGAQIGLLRQLGRADEAVQRGLEYVELSERLELSNVGQTVHVATAEALAELGRFAQATKLIDDVIAVASARGQSGVSIGSMYEARARVAARMNDRAAFEHFAQLCASEYRKGTSAFLAAKFSALLEEMRQGELGSLPASPLRDAVPAPNTEYLTIHSRMVECVDEDDRARCVLTMLLQELESFSGYLFAINDGVPALLSALPEEINDNTREVERWLRRYLVVELAIDEADAHKHTEPAQARGPGRLRLADGQRFEPLLLTCERAREEVLVGVLLYHSHTASRKHSSRRLVEQLALQLLEHGDASGITLAPMAHTQTRR